MRARPIVRGLIALVWLINGLWCKVLGQVPRHEAIVARVLSEELARPLTVTIGWLEVGMFVWVLSGVRARWCFLLQIALVVAMNAIEVTLARDLLLWGPLNTVFAGLFVALLWMYEFRRWPAD